MLGDQKKGVDQLEIELIDDGGLIPHEPSRKAVGRKGWCLPRTGGRSDPRVIRGPARWTFMGQPSVTKFAVTLIFRTSVFGRPRAMTSTECGDMRAGGSLASGRMPQSRR